MAYVTTFEASKRLSVTPLRIRQLIAAKRLLAARIGRDWLIAEETIKTYQRGKPGRPLAVQGESVHPSSKAKRLDLSITEEAD